MFASRMSDLMWSGPSDVYPGNDIWKKFDLDEPLENYHYRYQNDLMEDDSALSAIDAQPQHSEMSMMMHLDKVNCKASSEMRQHDCMWTGICISKEHSRAHPTKRDNYIHRIPAGASLLIQKNPQKQQTQTMQKSSQCGYSSQSQKMIGKPTTKTLESDGDSPRPETPQSTESETESEEDEEVSEEDEEDDDEEDDDDAPMFRHEQISINDIVSVSEVLGSRRPTLLDRRKAEEEQRAAENAIRNTLMSDHCYHLNQQQPINKKLEHLGVQTPSDSEEEIDVVSYDKPTRPAPSSSLPMYLNPAEPRFQLTVNTLKERQQNAPAAAATAPASTPVTTPRQRGRPRLADSAASRKRATQQRAADNSPKPAAKRARSTRTYTRRETPQKKAAAQQQLQQQQQQQQQLLQQQTPTKSQQSRSSSDEETDLEKRSLHNNMERQRRIDLRNAFEFLRSLVPELEHKEKAAKVTILRQSANYCDKLAQAAQMYDAKLSDLRRTQERLKSRVGLLRRRVAFCFSRG